MLFGLWSVTVMSTLRTSPSVLSADLVQGLILVHRKHSVTLCVFHITVSLSVPMNVEGPSHHFITAVKTRNFVPEGNAFNTSDYSVYFESRECLRLNYIFLLVYAY